MKSPGRELPDWFFDNCVRRSSEIAQHGSKLVIRESATSEAAQALGPRSISIEKDKYEIESFVFEALTRRILQRVDVASSNQKSRASRSVRFSHDSILLRLPGKSPTTATTVGAGATTGSATKQKPDANSKNGTEPEDGKEQAWLRDGGHDFLAAVVQTLAQKIQADLITLDIDDIRDLAEHIVTAKLPDADSSGDRSCVDVLFSPGKGVVMKQWDVQKREKQPLKRIAGASLDSEVEMMFFGKPRLFQAALTPPTIKQEGAGSGLPPLIIHIPEIFRFIEETEYRSVLKQLNGALGQLPERNGDVIIIATTQAPEAVPCDHDVCEGCQPEDHELLSRLSSNPDDESFCIFPVKSQAQKKLFQQDAEYQTGERNTRLLKRRLRQLPSNRETPLAQPYAKWELPSSSNAMRMLREGPLEKTEAIAQEVGVPGSLDRIRDVLEMPYRYNAARAQWMQDTSAMAFGWELTLPPHARDAVRRIQTEEKFEYEAQLLDTIVDPNNLDETWDDIEVDHKVKSRISHMIALSSGETVSSAYGVLKKNLIKGALVYGPPGTGKTHLARVLAKESGILMLLVSAADIESKWHGDTEKYIKAIFSLGRMLSPCLIFIDEADALFRRRTSDDKRHERKYLNQFLGEIEGLGRNNKAPFIMIATNAPGDLDHALLRRIPGRFYIGYPTVKAREQIFRILLRDEQLHPDVNLAQLAEQARQYTGSDIRTVCVQAAMICEEELVESGRYGTSQRRLIEMRHLQEALDTGSPVGPSLDLSEMAQFAKELDPSALDMIQTDEARMQAESMGKEGLSGNTTPPTLVASSSMQSLSEAETRASRDEKETKFEGIYKSLKKIPAPEVALVEITNVALTDVS